MRAWQYSSTKGGLPKNLHLNPSVPIPKPSPTQHLIRIKYVALNPVDYKPAEVYLFHRLILPKPATPGADFCGEVVVPAAGGNGKGLKKGDVVFGVAKSPFAGGMLAEYAVVEKDSAVAIGKGMEAVHAACIGVAGLTALQCIGDRVAPGSDSRLFLNGGSGGTGVFGIQFAKAMGFYVTVTCSGKNAEVCRELGADEVIDYTKGDVVGKLKESCKVAGRGYDLVVDNVGKNPELYWKCHEYLREGARYVNIAGEPSVRFFWQTIKMTLLPGWMGGGRRKLEGFFAQTRKAELEQIRDWFVEGKVKAVVDGVYGFEEAREAFVKLKTWRAVGKIVVRVEGGQEK